MEQSVLRFQFKDAAGLSHAFDTLQELGYDPVREQGQLLHIHIERQDLTSALEIAEACGGQLVEEAGRSEMNVMDEAYGMHMIPIPAHLVNEDWADDAAYAVVDPRGDDLSHREEEAIGWDDELSNQFPGGVHL